LIREAKK